MSDYLYQTTDVHGDPFEVEYEEITGTYYVTTYDKVDGKPIESISELRPEQMRAMVLAVGSHVQKNGSA